MRRVRSFLIGFLLIAPALWAANSLEIYFIDVEGGQSTLIVDPQGESLLIDTGWPDSNHRDADRILSAAKAASIDHIDYVLLTHYHSDHAGGISQLASRIPITTFADHGPNMEPTQETSANYATYLRVIAQSPRLILKPGDRLPLKGMQVEVLTSAGAEITMPLPGAGQPNPLCPTVPSAPVDLSENSRSVGVLLTYGQFRFIDLGDLTTRGELGLVCPRNLVGQVDVYLTTHHGTAHPGSGDSSNAREIVEALRPRVAIMNNGAIKGGHPMAWQIVHQSPGLEDLWQLHYAVMSDKDHNVAEQFIANTDEGDDGHYIELLAEPNATFTVINSRNNFQKTYKK
ncbi:MAG TPA: MBL fold metallo-hydrolase [Candidatus Acidoferrales bacterium]|nr:MBL fold metallo-hydrolase [Candidatus Acidoferrales bacterium]